MQKRMKKLITDRRVILFVASAVLFLIPTVTSNLVLATFDVTSIRLTPVLNPVLGIAYGWPAILGCTVANFISDLFSGYGLLMSGIGLLSQTMYGALPYYVWRRYIGCRSHLTRLDSPRKVISFAILMAVNSFLIGLCVGGFQVMATGSGYWAAARFAMLNDFDISMIFGLPLMAFIDHLYSRYTHEGRRKLSFNEKISLYAAGAEFIVFLVIAAVMIITGKYDSRAQRWEHIFALASYVVNGLLILTVGVMLYFHNLRVKHAGLRIFEKKNGTIYVDEKKRLEFISYPGKELRFRVKSDALGYTYENTKKPCHPSYEEVWYCVLSPQKGCPMKCAYCDCPGYGYYGNATMSDLAYQIDTIVENSGTTHTKWFQADFTRMGDAALNPALLPFIENDLRKHVLSKVDADTIFPTVSTMMPRSAKNTVGNFLAEFCRIKNSVYHGYAGLEISLNSTDESIRRRDMRNMAMSLEEIAGVCAGLPTPVGQKYALTFAVTRDSIIDAALIDRLFDKDKFLIKIHPIHRTFNAVDNGYKVTTEYEDYEVFSLFEKQFLDKGWDVMVYLDSDEQDKEALTDGNLLLSSITERFSDKAKDKKRVGLLVAIEMDAVFKLYPRWKELHGPFGYKLYLVDKGDYQVYIMQSGMGEIAAAAAVQYLISKCDVDMIINFGVVGGLTKDMNKQKVCLVDRVVHYKYDCSEFMDLKVGQLDGRESIFIRPTESLVKNARALMSDLSTATCCSGDKFVSTVEEKTYLHETFEGDICDMESAGIVLTCETNRVPCLLIKAVADGLADGAAGFFAELQAASDKCLKVADQMMERLTHIEF